MTNYTIVPMTEENDNIFTFDTLEPIEMLVKSNLAFQSTPPTTVAALSLYQYVIASYDNLDDTTLTLTATSMPLWATFTDEGNGIGVLHGYPQVHEIGMYDIVLEVTDGYLTITQTYTLEVTDSVDEPTDDPATDDLGVGTLLVFIGDYE